MKKRISLLLFLCVLIVSSLSTTAFAMNCNFSIQSSPASAQYINLNASQHTKIFRMVFACSTQHNCNKTQIREIHRVNESHKYLYNNGTHNSNGTHTFTGKCACSRTTTLTSKCTGPRCVTPNSEELDVR